MRAKGKQLRNPTLWLRRCLWKKPSFPVICMFCSSHGEDAQIALGAQPPRFSRDGLNLTPSKTGICCRTKLNYLEGLLVVVVLNAGKVCWKTWTRILNRKENISV